MMTLPDALIRQIDAWMAQAEDSEPRVSDAMQVASVDAQGQPSVRTVLLKSWDADGLVFYTNYGSRKAMQLDATRRVAAVLHWKTLARQLIVEGRVERTSAAQSDAYFASRGRGSQLGAWASHQSQPLQDRQVLVDALRVLELQYEGQPVPRPPNWGGYRIVPSRVELWQDRDDRLHERVLYELGETGWSRTLLFP